MSADATQQATQEATQEDLDNLVFFLTRPEQEATSPETEVRIQEAKNELLDRPVAPKFIYDCAQRLDQDADPTGLASIENNVRAMKNVHVVVDFFDPLSRESNIYRGAAFALGLPIELANRADVQAAALDTSNRQTHIHLMAEFLLSYTRIGPKLTEEYLLQQKKMAERTLKIPYDPYAAIGPGAKATDLPWLYGLALSGMSSLGEGTQAMLCVYDPDSSIFFFDVGMSIAAGRSIYLCRTGELAPKPTPHRSLGNALLELDRRTRETHPEVRRLQIS